MRVKFGKFEQLGLGGWDATRKLKFDRYSRAVKFKNREFVKFAEFAAERAVKFASESKLNLSDR